MRAQYRAEMQLGLPTRVASNTAEPGGADPAWAAPPSPLGERGGTEFVVLFLGGAEELSGLGL